MSSIDNNGINYLPEPYPLIMDASFLETDEKYIESIINVIPEIATQFIFVLGEEFLGDVKAVLSEREDTKYIIDKHSETSSTLNRIDNV